MFFGSLCISESVTALSGGGLLHNVVLPGRVPEFRKQLPVPARDLAIEGISLVSVHYFARVTFSFAEAPLKLFYFFGTPQAPTHRWKYASGMAEPMGRMTFLSLRVWPCPIPRIRKEAHPEDHEHGKHAKTPRTCAMQLHRLHLRVSTNIQGSSASSPPGAFVVKWRGSSSRRRWPHNRADTIEYWVEAEGIDA